MSSLQVSGRYYRLHFEMVKVLPWNSVFDIMQANDFAKEFDDYGKEKIEFAQLAKIWEDNKYEARVS